MKKVIFFSVALLISNAAHAMNPGTSRKSRAVTSEETNACLNLGMTPKELETFKNNIPQHLGTVERYNRAGVLTYEAQIKNKPKAQNWQLIAEHLPSGISVKIEFWQMGKRNHVPFDKRYNKILMDKYQESPVGN